MATKRSIRARRFTLEGTSALTKLEAAVLIDSTRSVLNLEGCNRGLPGWTSTQIDKLESAYGKLVNSWNCTYEVDR